MLAPSFFACQLASALNKSFSRRLEASFGLYFKMAKAFSTSTPRIWSATKRILRGEVGQSLSLAIAIAFFAALSASAVCFFLAPISYLFLFILTVTTEVTGWRKFTEFVTYHVLSYIHRNKCLSVVYTDSLTNKVW